MAKSQKAASCSSTINNHHNVTSNHSITLERCEAVILNPAIGNIVPQPLDGKASLLEVDATLLNGCHRPSETPSKLADKNPEEKSIRIKNIRNLLNLPWYIADEDIQTLEDSTGPRDMDIIGR